MKFVEELYGQILLVCVNPNLGLSMEDRYRQVLLKRYPYTILYEVDEAAGMLYIVAVGHQRRHPDYWRPRVQEEPAAYQLAA